jgi:hypothetical protein
MSDKHIQAAREARLRAWWVGLAVGGTLVLVVGLLGTLVRGFMP